MAKQVAFRSLGKNVETLKQLLDAIPTPKMAAYPGPLQKYLIALWQVIQQSQDTQITPTLLYKLLDEATEVEFAHFDENWMRYEAPPYRYQSDEQSEFEYLKQTILFQIADLRRMEKQGTLNLRPTILFGGVQSPTGHGWYNFSVEDYFECAASRYKSHCKNYSKENEWTAEIEKIGRPLESNDCSWRDLAEMLELGRLSE